MNSVSIFSSFLCVSYLSTLVLGFSPSLSLGGVVVTVSGCSLEPCPEGVSAWLEVRATEAKNSSYGCSFEKYEPCLIKIDPSVKACFDPLLEFKKLKKQSEDSEMGAYQFKDSYYEAEPVKSKMDLKVIPKVLQDPMFLAKINNPRTSADAIKEFRAKNPKLTVIRYSGNARALDNNKEEDRLLILFTGEKEDRYYQFTVPTLEEERKAKDQPLPDLNSDGFLKDTAYNQFSLVLVDKSEVRAPSDRPKVYFRDYQRKAGDHGVVFGYRNGPRDSRESCLKCHSQGVQAIFPNIDRTSEEDRMAIQRLNGRILEYGIPSNATAKIKSLPNGLSTVGLPLGPLDSPVRTDEFMAKCAPKISVERRNYIKEKMNCSGCHNGKAVELNKEIPNLKKAFGWGYYELAPLYNVNGGILSQIISNHNVMPPGIEASKDEREALWNCLVQENEILSEQAMNDVVEKYSCEGLTAVKAVSSGMKDSSGIKATQEGDPVRRSGNKELPAKESDGNSAGIGN